MHVRSAPWAKRLLIAGVLSTFPFVAGTSQVEDKAVYRPELPVSEAMQPFLKHLEPGNDGFPLERQAQEIAARLGELSDALRAGAARTASVVSRLIDPGFRGARLLPIEAAA